MKKIFLVGVLALTISFAKSQNAYIKVVKDTTFYMTNNFEVYDTLWINILPVFQTFEKIINDTVTCHLELRCFQHEAQLQQYFSQGLRLKGLKNGVVIYYNNNTNYFSTLKNGVEAYIKELYGEDIVVTFIRK
jgi:hypothetical protein